ncbi:DUF4212 domain-containing protein [Undibacterium sp. Jales W-56]|uniref:DUF4212 domain-containing protein n=1 Tax=Undibacterium sp. Jales W-56 TaxID=2897325 RepID=UPI0021D0E039|nr:DUF4212 domain-containing protein [Undibacterium sp. Jales W-56]MCU6434562.1 DUF4212 domain-containing protein [Undibacterium sp. Jales W-56]
MEASTAAPSSTSVYWRHTRQLTVILLASWLLLTFGVLFFARELALYTFFGWPFSFYMAAQGLTLFYVLLLAVLSFVMRRIEQAHQTHLANQAEHAVDSSTPIKDGV